MFMRILVVLLAAAILLGCVVQETKTNVPGPAMNDSGKNDSGMMNNSDMLNDSAGLEIVSSDLSYFNGAKGYISKPKSAGSYPGVIMIHEWWGLNDNIRDMAKMLAAKGYVVLAVDLYDGKVAASSDEARQLVTSLNQSRANENMQAAIAYLRENESATKMASMGWCFGGGQSLQVSMSGEELDATIIYYGNVNANETQLSAIDWPVLGIFGENDTGIPPSAVNEFESKLDNLGIENDIYIYPGVGHAFANPSGMNYAPNETKDAWKKTVDFLQKHLK
jgi:carboxymethylenebutenolidase